MYAKRLAPWIAAVTMLWVLFQAGASAQAHDVDPDRLVEQVRNVVDQLVCPGVNGRVGLEGKRLPDLKDLPFTNKKLAIGDYRKAYGLFEFTGTSPEGRDQIYTIFWYDFTGTIQYDPDKEYCYPVQFQRITFPGPDPVVSAHD